MDLSAVGIITTNPGLTAQLHSFLSSDYNLHPLYCSDSSAKPASVAVLIVDGRDLLQGEARLRECLNRNRDALLCYVLPEGMQPAPVDRLIRPASVLCEPLHEANLRASLDLLLRFQREQHGAVERERRQQEEGRASAISVRTFGSFDVRRGGEQLDLGRWRSKKAVYALALLALHYPDPVHKEQLAAALWPEAAAETGIRRLHQAISEVRRNLQPNLPRYERSEIISYERGLYRLEPGPGGKVDHREFQHQVEQGDARWAGSEHASAVSFYRMALNRASGVFFPAYRYEESFDPRRAELEELQDRARSRVELWEELRRPSRRPRPSPSTADSA